MPWRDKLASPLVPRTRKLVPPIFALASLWALVISTALAAPKPVAELVKAGCIVFVPNSGGQKEIVDTPKLTYDDIDDAVTKITDVLDQSSLRKSLLKHLDQKQKMFSTSVFRQEMQAVVQDLIAAEG